KTVNSLEPSSSNEEPQVPATVLAQSAEEAGPKRAWPGSHCSGCPDEATESNVGLSAYRPTNGFGFRYSNQQGCSSADSRCSIPSRARLGWSFMAHFPGSHEGQPLEPRPLSMRIRNFANTLGFGRNGPIHAAHCWIWCSRRHRGWSGPMPDVQSSDSRAESAKIPQLGSRSAVSVPPMASQSSNTRDSGNQDCALRAALASIRRARHRYGSARIPRPASILDHDRSGDEANRFPTLL